MSSLKLPGSVGLQLTENCNLRCHMCYFWGDSGIYSIEKAQPKVLDLNILKDLIDYLSPRKPFYSFFGGEPLLYPHLEELIRYIKKNNSIVDTPTNGTLLAKNAKILVETKFNSVRVSIDGSKEINDAQRGKGSYEKAIKGINTLHLEKKKVEAKFPYIRILFTLTPLNYHNIEQFLLNDINLNAIDSVSVQIENYLTEEMGLTYSKFLKEKLSISSEKYWRGFLRDPKYFKEIDTIQVAHQIENIKKRFRELDIGLNLLPPTYTPKNLSAYFSANWNEMTDKYANCSVPWYACEITANGDVAPCHIFYDLVVGNLYEQQFDEIWNNNKYRIFRDYMKEHKLMSICPGCCILYLQKPVNLK